jgi:hypothetical protein
VRNVNPETPQKLNEVTKLDAIPVFAMFGQDASHQFRLASRSQRDAHLGGGLQGE